MMILTFPLQPLPVNNVKRSPFPPNTGVRVTRILYRSFFQILTSPARSLPLPLLYFQMLSGRCGVRTPLFPRRPSPPKLVAHVPVLSEGVILPSFLSPPGRVKVVPGPIAPACATVMFLLSPRPFLRPCFIWNCFFPY